MHTILLGVLRGAIVASPRLNTFIVPDKMGNCREVSITESVYIHLRPEPVLPSRRPSLCLYASVRRLLGLPGYDFGTLVKPLALAPCRCSASACRRGLRDMSATAQHERV